MVKICVESPEVSMHGEINIHAQVAIVTKAKLDAISVNGTCNCGDAPAPEVVTDYVIVIDGSDSYNNKVTVGGKTTESEAFEQTQVWCAGLIDAISQTNKASTVSLIQFSGIKQKEKDYKPGTWGEIGGGLSHYRVQIEPTTLSDVRRLKKQCTDFDALDGNGQLFLCLQDLAMDKFTSLLRKALPGSDRKTVMIVVSDEEWDCKHLENAFGSGKATPESVCKAVHSTYNAVHAVVVRPNKFNDQNEDFICKELTKTKSNYHKVYTENFDTNMNKAGNTILESLGYGTVRSFF
jgi:hypothetical protein